LTFPDFDDVVMEALDDDKDEVDFVQLRDGPSKGGTQVDKADVMMMEEDTSGDEEETIENKAAARADRYDFNSMVK
jgi:hypothetical protein